MRPVSIVSAGSRDANTPGSVLWQCEHDVEIAADTAGTYLIDIGKIVRGMDQLVGVTTTLRSMA